MLEVLESLSTKRAVKATLNERYTRLDKLLELIEWLMRSREPTGSYDSSIGSLSC